MILPFIFVLFVKLVPIALYLFSIIWSVVAIGCEKWLPGGRKFYALGIAAICWAIWKARDKTCFGGKLLKNPIEILCHPCAIPQEDDQDGDDD